MPHSTLQGLPLFLSILFASICLSADFAAADDDLSEDSPVVDLTLSGKQFVSRYQDASINGHDVKLESFSLSEPASQSLYGSADGSSFSDAPDGPTVKTIVVQNASYNHLYIGEVSDQTQYMFIFNYTEAEKITATRIQLFSSQANKVYPVTCVARQQEGILSWQLPLEVEDSYSYWWSSRTLCPVDKNHKEHIEKQQLIYVTISSMSREKKDFNLTTLIVNDFQIEHDVPKTFGVSVARPKYYMYYFPDGIDHVLLRVTSKSETCMTVSVQKIKCPVFDLETNVEYGGKYQTMSTQATMLLQRDDYPDINGFYVVFITKANDKDCVGHVDSVEIIPNALVMERRKTVSIMITDTITNAEYWKATTAAFGFFLMFYVIAFIVLCSCHKCGLPKTFSEMSPEDMEVARSLLERTKRVRFNIQADVTASDSSTGSGNGDQFLHPSSSQGHYGATENGDLGSTRGYRRELSAVSTSSGLIDEAAIDFLSDADYEKDVFRTKTSLYVSDLARKKRSKLGKIYRTFYWNLLTIAIFYGLPVIQLVITYQRVLNETGNLDLCYYNFGCAHPFKDALSAFNNVFSNIGYVMLGLLFIIIVRVRDRQSKRTFEEYGELAEKYGIPQHFGLFYAMGIALCMEGVMSASYHVCPSYQNFQFDTSFMYIIACLIMLKIYQCRHPDINAKAHVAYFSMALIILIAVIGVIYGNSVFWILYALFHMLMALVFTAQLYYMGRWSIDRYVFKRAFLFFVSDIRHCSRPTYPHRFCLLLVGNIVNWGFAIYGAVVQPNNFASFFLGIFIGNLLLYIVFYLIMKLWSRERLSWLVIVVILTSMITWGGSLYFFFNQLSNWQRSPAGSREQNRSCMLMKFYDTHDVWHFLSALSMFFSFLIIFLLDDDLAQTRRDRIPVF